MTFVPIVTREFVAWCSAGSESCVSLNMMRVEGVLPD